MYLLSSIKSNIIQGKILIFVSLYLSGCLLLQVPDIYDKENPISINGLQVFWIR